MASGDIVEGLGTAGTPVGGVVSVNVVGSTGTQAVSGTVGVSNFPATQPISGSVSVSNFPATQDVSDRLARILGQIIDRPTDSNLFHAPAINVIATVTFPATAGKRWVLAHATWAMQTNAATANALHAKVTDGATQVFDAILGVTATASAVDRFTLVRPGIASAVGAALIVAFGAAGATITESVTAGAWQV